MLDTIRSGEKSESPVRIILADDHPVVLLGTRMVLTNTTHLPIHISAEVSCTDTLLQALEREPCDLLITDLFMPGGKFADGISLISYLCRTLKNTKIIVMTMTRHELIIKHLLKLNIHGIFDKHAPLAELNMAVHSVLHGHRYISQSYSSTLAGAKRGEPIQKRLSLKEHEVIRLLASGLAGREIAKRVNRSEKTISRQKRSAMQKMGITSLNRLNTTAWTGL